jgi:starch-binding outer membrane protein SusE/F
MKKLIFYITILGLLLNSCKKDETKVVMLTNPTPPTLVSLPDLTLQRAHGLDTLVFVGTAVDPGFKASATYFLEACASGNNFKDSLQVLSSNQDASLKITVSALNGILLQKFTADVASAVDFRIRSVLSIDAGTGAVPKIYASDPVSANVTIFGLPRLDLINSGITQKVESALGDGKYIGYVKLDATKPFTLKDPDANITYGANGTALAVNGAAFTVAANGWYQLKADTKAYTFTNIPYNIGLIGDATPNGWNAPDSKMAYDDKTGSWFISITLINGTCKFRMNDAWDQGINLGIGTGYSIDNLWNNGSSSNIPVTAGSYTVRLYINTTPFRCTFTLNK